MFDLLFSYGGLVAYALLFCSVVALSATIYSAYSLIPQRLAASKLSQLLPTLNREEIAHHADTGHALARVLAAGIRGTSPEQCQALAFDRAQRQMTLLERGLGVIATIAQISPLLGLLGTVLGLIDAFQHAGPNQAEAMSTGIYQALATTAAGLIVAIPAWTLYQSLAGMSGTIARECEHLANDHAWWQSYITQSGK